MKLIPLKVASLFTILLCLGGYVQAQVDTTVFRMADPAMMQTLEKISPELLHTLRRPHISRAYTQKVSLANLALIDDKTIHLPQKLKVKEYKEVSGLRLRDLFWTQKGSVSFDFSNVGLVNWQGGGEPSISLGGRLEYENKRESKASRWTNQFRFDYGVAKLGDRDFRKTRDEIFFATQFNGRFNRHWSFSNTLNFKSQIAEGKKYDGDDNATKISNFMAPGYLQATMGIQYEDLDYYKSFDFTVVASPIAGKLTFVLDEELSEQGKFGVEKGKKVRSEMGFNLHSTFNAVLLERIKFLSKMNFFSNFVNLGKFDVDWETSFDMRINKYLSTVLGTRLIYDEDMTTDIQFQHVLKLKLEYQL
ncbi:DUF3078 domain-containing protein [Rapidithrix thailandica]|uniref:DUF3078 domain-containing protein n=1 Tax=Rapidithrix thailandica TaxID=413964 RepID=A0AAW9SI25_9BACT